MLTLPIIIPILAALLVLAAPGRIRFLKETVSVTAMAANLLIAVLLFGKVCSYSIPWIGSNLEFSLICYGFNSLIILAASCFGFLIALYSAASLRDKNYSKPFFALFLASFSFLNGAVLSDNLITMLFFWEGALITLFGMIAVGNRSAFKTATKAFIILGSADLALLVGIALCGNLAGTFTISKIHLTPSGLGGAAFILLMIGAIAKSGSMPFHSWIPDAAVDAPLPFMALVPGAVEKLLGIYFLTRLSLDMFKIEHVSWASYTLMIIGSITILAAVMMALVQKDYKKLLSYHAISQIGYMVLGIGTMVPAGIIGGIFHMLNNAIYKSCLFLTGGSVEKQTGTTNLEGLGGVGRTMPVTFACFIITALSISGVPPFNGFFSKELVYDGALERGKVFYLVAIIGSFLTAASFLKLGHAAFLGKLSEKNKAVKEAPVSMLIPMIVLALTCIIFGIFNALPIHAIQQVLGLAGLEGHDFAGFPSNMMLVVITVAVLAAALINHIYGVKKTGSGLKASDHIHYAPVLKNIYAAAEKGRLDPFNIGSGLVRAFANIATRTDRAVDWIYNKFTVDAAGLLTSASKRIHNGNYSTYIIWSFAAMAAIMLLLIKK